MYCGGVRITDTFVKENNLGRFLVGLLILALLGNSFIVPISAYSGTETSAKSTQSAMEIVWMIEAEFSGGLGLTIVFKNTGTIGCENILWDVYLSDGFCVLKQNASGFISRLSPGEQVTVKTGILPGLGKVTIDVSFGKGAWIWDVTAFLLGPLMFLVDATNEKSVDLFMHDVL